MVNYTEKEFRSILNVRKYVDSWFWERYGVNCYNGCQMGCVYCDSRSAKYHLPEDFENDIIVKRAPEKMLDDRLRRARTLLPDVVGMSGASDPYQAAEKKYGNTGRCIEVLVKQRYPLHVITKSTLVLRDLDLLSRIGKDSWCCVSVTITTADTEVAAFLEKGAPAPEERLDVIRTIKREAPHVQAGVLMIPIVPCLCDSNENLEAVVKCAKDAGADYVLFGGGMTLRDRQALWFLKHLKERFPEHMDRYEELYGFRYDPHSYDGSYEVDRGYVRGIHKKMMSLCEKHGLAYRISRFIPDDFRKWNYIVAQELLDEAYRRQMLGGDWKNMQWAGLNIQNLKESVVDVAGRGELGKIRNMDPEVEKVVMEVLPKEKGRWRF
jgi:DNA repair photolyase